MKLLIVILSVSLIFGVALGDSEGATSSSSTDESSSSTSSSSKTTEKDSSSASTTNSEDNTTPKPQCNDDEEYNECGTACEKNCTNYHKPIICTRQCVAGCFCKDGKIRADDGVTCVNPEDCESSSGRKSKASSSSSSPSSKGKKKKPAPKCYSNEVYKTCGSDCEPTCDDYNQPRICTLQCIEGCFCEDGLVRASNGTCIDPNQCPPITCGPNEHYVKDNTTCIDIGGVTFCDTFTGCVCDNGYERDIFGVCVLAKEYNCGPNAIPNSCHSDCEMTCTTRIRSTVCSAVCKKGCTCREGFLKHKNGTCVPIDQCSEPECNNNEVHSTCGTACEDTCDNFNNTCRVCTQQCVDGCFCKKGYVRASDGITCIPKNKCPKPSCGVNEYYDFCPKSDCRPQTCFSIVAKYNCSLIDSENRCCEPKCRCIDGYLRDTNGTCIEIKDCPQLNGNPINNECGENEVYSDCKRSCPAPICDTKFNPVFCFVPDDCRFSPNPGCDCKEGYLRNGTTDDPCIPESKCKPLNPDDEIKCSINEEPTDCYNSCFEKTCDSRYDGGNKFCPPFCTKGCKCNDGYLRNRNGKCVPENKCPPPKCSRGEVFKECGSACEDNCNNYQDTNRACTKQCVQGCFCENGKVRGSDGRCIFPALCPFSHGCAKNEFYVVNSQLCQKTCNNRNRFMGICPPFTGCICKAGFVRNNQGQCIRTDHCPAIPTPDKCKKNEVWSDCRINCPPQTCLSIYTSFSCVENPPCEPGCDCIDGYLRNGTANNLCIPSEKCPPPKPEPQQQCGANEEPVDCYNSCQENNCKDRFRHGNKVCPLYCEVNKCACKKDYYRNSEGDCVRADQCDAAQCRQDEQYSDCGTACEKNCANYNDEVVCTDQCVEGCFCKKGLIRAAEGSCVKPENCVPINPGKCNPKTEVWSPCRKLCPPQYCDARFAQFKCLIPPPCQAGCNCRTGFYRNGTTLDAPCVPEDKCPARPNLPGPLACRPNEQLNHCWSPCEKTCTTRLRSDGKVCAAECRDGCSCVAGYLRHKNGTCVPVGECSEPKCNADEYHPKCGPSCEDTCASYNNTCRVCSLRCADGCFCRPGTVRADDGTCVEKSSCPVPQCGKNQHYETCPDQSKPDTCAARGKKITSSNLRKCCAPRCVCDYGYLMTKNGDCVKECDCD